MRCIAQYIVYSMQPEGEGSINMCYTPSRGSIMDDEDSI